MTQQTQYILSELYSRKGSVKKTLYDLFTENAAKGEKTGMSKYSNFLDLVEFAKSEECRYNSILNGRKNELSLCCSQIEAVLEMLKKHKRNDEAAWGKELLDELKNEPYCSHLCNFYLLITKNWEILKDWSVTYQLLANLVKLEPQWFDDVETKERLAKIIRKLSDKWKD